MTGSFVAHSKNELMQWRGVCRLSVSVNFCANRFYSQTIGRIATKLSQDGLQVSMHPGCAQVEGQGQRSRGTRTFLDSWNELLRHWRSGCFSGLVLSIVEPNNFGHWLFWTGVYIKPKTSLSCQRIWPYRFSTIRISYLSTEFKSSLRCLAYI